MTLRSEKTIAVTKNCRRLPLCDFMRCFSLLAAAAAVPDLLSGRLHITRNRTRPAPEIPTIVEAGIANFSIYGWFAYFAPAKTPEAVVSKLEREISVVLQRPDTQSLFEKIGLETGEGPSRKELGAFVKEQMVSWAAAARDAGMQPQ